MVTTCPQVVIGVTPALTLLLAGAGQSEEGWQLAGSSLPRARFVPAGGVAKFCTRMPSPEPSELPPRNPLPPAWLPFRVAALPETQMPWIALPEAFVVVTDTKAPWMKKPSQAFPEAVDELTEVPWPTR